jgi:hypothetical protein
MLNQMGLTPTSRIMKGIIAILRWAGGIAMR